MNTLAEVNGHEKEVGKASTHRLKPGKARGMRSFGLQNDG